MKLIVLTIPQHETTLRTKSEPISVEQIKTPEMQKFFQDLEETMQKADGAGLAAPQVGKLIRAVAVNMGDNAQIFINPKIIKKNLAQERD